MKNMKKEMNLASAGLLYYPPPIPQQNAEIRENRRREEWEKWVSKEKRRMEGIADIRMRAAENALKAAVRLDCADADIKEAQLAAMELG